MPNYCRFKKDGVIVNPVDVDAAMCEAFGAPVDPVDWFRSWMDIAGFSIACGTTDERFREMWGDTPRQIEVWDWLHANYECDGYYMGK